MAVEISPAVISFEPSIIYDELKLMADEQQVMSVDAAYYNNLQKPDHFWRRWHKKTFFSANTIKELDHGYHEGTSRKAEGRRSTRFVHFHLHYKPHALHVAHSKEKMKSQVDVEDKEALDKIKHNRLVQVILEDEPTYLKRFDEAGSIAIPAFQQRLRAIGKGVPYT